MSLDIVRRILENNCLLSGKRILIVGDIALDRTYRCRPAVPGYHATHGAEEIIDVEAGGDDFGTVGSANNTCIFVSSFGAEPFLITAYGDDEEGERIETILKAHSASFRGIVLPGIQSVTRLRFFVFNPAEGCFNLRFRADKDPDCNVSYQKAEELVCTIEFLAFFKAELSKSDVVIFNDTEKGFLSAKVLESFGKVILETNEARKEAGSMPVGVIVDPKFDWQKFKLIPTDILKANEREAEKAVDLPQLDYEKDDHLMILGERLYRHYGDHYQRIIVTLGRHGAALLDSQPEDGKLYRLPGIRSPQSQFRVATHCGDMFGSAMALGMCLGNEDVFSITAFANCIGSLQFAKLSGQKVTYKDLAESGVIEYFQAHQRPPQLVTTLSDEKTKVVSEILGNVGSQIDHHAAVYSRQGRKGCLIASKEFSARLDTLAQNIRPGSIVYITGESGVGKGAILENMNLFVESYEKEEDCYNAHQILDSADGLNRAIAHATSRCTCIILDEIQQASDSGISTLLSEFAAQDFDRPFCVIVAGHYDCAREALRDLYWRASQFEIPPYRDKHRRYDLPYLIAKIIRERKEFSHIKKITALALRELLRCDYVSTQGANWRALKKVLVASCNKVDGEILDWDHLDLSEGGGKKADQRPSNASMNYEISLA